MQVQKPILKQEQKLKLTPQLFQAIKLMSLPIQDLRRKIEEELERNPALEIIEDKSSISLEEVQKKDNDDYNNFEESSDPGYSKSRSEEASDRKRQFIEGVLSRSESLQDHLIWQLRLQPIDPSWFRIGELLIRNLDKNGFHIEPPEVLVDESEQKLLKPIMKIIQSFEPVGVCTTDYRESLLVQIENHPHPHPLSLEIVRDHIGLLEKGKYEQILKKLKADEADFNAAIDFIKTLEPIPGRNFSTESPQFVIPDIMVKEKDGDFVIFLNDEEIPVLGISLFFKEIASKQNGTNQKKLTKFVNSNLNDARWFIHSIGQRNETLLKTCRAIIEFQRKFFRMGPKYLIPLTRKDIAQEIGVHEATVSRITTGKYIQTEWGIFELRYFFSNSISGAGSTGSRYSKQGVKEIIKEIIEEEEKIRGKNQLTDKKIADILATRGIKVARRTVSKYRKELDIGSSFNR